MSNRLNISEQENHLHGMGMDDGGDKEPHSSEKFTSNCAYHLLTSLFRGVLSERMKGENLNPSVT